MLKILMPDIMPEFMAIEAKNNHFIKLNIGKLHDVRSMLENEKHLWMPLLCILSAKIIKDVTIKTYQLAEIFHLLSYASQLHWSLPENNKDSKEDMKIDVLSGDLIYSRIYSNICQYGLQPYLLPFSNLISAMNESLILRDFSRENDDYEIRVFASLTESACYLGGSSASNNQLDLNVLKEFGYHLGILKSVYDKGKNIDEHYSSWQNCWDRVEEIKTSKRHCFEKILRHMGEEWEIDKPVLIQERVI
ncbi:MAG: hypothetical protein CVU87_11535 [Firmicutes bacterium HGW-Firmicutes-12]|nr:MAG: hypothetical protein CVU87_11535 [Firmicutes bacterium HGW-Firmicutes-12]